jgi:hypothetical protein
MRPLAHCFLIALAALAAGTAGAHPGHATLGALAGSAHLHLFDVALALAAVAALVLAAPTARQRLGAGLPVLRSWAASGRVRALGAALALAVALLLLLG